MAITRRQFVLGTLAAGSTIFLRQNFLYGKQNRERLRQPGYLTPHINYVRDLGPLALRPPVSRGLPFSPTSAGL